MSGLFYGKFYEILKGNFEPIFTTIKLTNCMYTFGDVVVSKKITVKYCSRSVRFTINFLLFIIIIFQ